MPSLYDILLGPTPDARPSAPQPTEQPVEQPTAQPTGYQPGLKVGNKQYRWDVSMYRDWQMNNPEIAGEYDIQRWRTEILPTMEGAEPL